ncbi:nitrile hydratase subunit beta [Rhodococcus sp. MS16]|uniref:SH3-like domain-containing protein n=1 Tax=Rhodococcus sp. MS16 TaxID=2579941 RepID=UPI001562723E|nr:SH3-like domain-containing protein [Rhodococcus sp. MS16]NRI69852.1 nitrile hydratase subunit beta [Rhodococcus sp. MS16]
MTSAQGYDVVFATLTDATGREDGLPDTDRKPEPWESAMQATCECLSWRGTWDNLERRQTEDALGETIYSKFPVHSRSVISTAHTLIDRGILDENELNNKMSEVRSRLNQD